MEKDAHSQKNEVTILNANITNIRTATDGVKFCYGLTLFLRILAVVLGLVNIFYVMYFKDYDISIIYLIISVGCPCGLSFLPGIVYIISARNKKKKQKK